MDNDTAKKLTDQIAKDMLAKFASPEFQTFIKSVNDATDTGTFEMVISTDNIDRHGEIVDQKGIDFTNYMTNPVVLWGHNHNQMNRGNVGVLVDVLSEGGSSSGIDVVEIPAQVGGGGNTFIYFG